MVGVYLELEVSRGTVIPEKIQHGSGRHTSPLESDVVVTTLKVL